LQLLVEENNRLKESLRIEEEHRRRQEKDVQNLSRKLQDTETKAVQLWLFSGDMEIEVGGR